MLQLILGLNDTARTDLFCREIQQRLDEKAPTWILVPEQFSLYMEKELIRRFGLSAQRLVRVLSFSRLCNLVLQHKGPLRMKYMDGAGKQILAARTMELLSGKLTALGQNLRQKGFAKVLVDTISECKRYGVPPQALRFAADKTDQEDLRNKLLDLAELYETYDQLLTAQSADAEDNLALVCPRLHSCDFLTGKLYVLYFRSFTPVEYQALGELMRRLDVSVALEYTDSPAYAGLFSPVEGAIRRLRELAETVGIEELPPIKLPPKPEATALGYLAGRYFDSRAKVFDGDCESLAVYEVPNTYRETEAAADLILRLCRREGLKYSDFLILARNIEPYRRMMPAIFERRGIRVFLDTRRSITAKPLVRLIYGVLDILAYGYSYERVMNIAACELLRLDRAAVDELENYILAVAPTHAMWQTERWEFLPSHGDYDLKRINQTKDVLFSGVKAIQGKISGTKTGGELAGAMLDWLKQSGVAETLTQKAQASLEEGHPELADEYTQTWNAVLSVLSQISAVMHDTPMTYRRFAELFETACGGIEIGMTPQTIDCVTFSQIDRFRSSNAKVVLVLGMNEGVFPQGYMTEGLLSDTERQAMLNLGVELAPGRESKRKEEQLLIHAVLSAPTQALYFFRSVMDKEGKRLMPSAVIKRTKELFPALTTLCPDRELFLKGTEGTAGAFDALAATLAEYGGDAEYLPKPLGELYTWFSQKEGYKEQLSKLHAAMTAKPPTALTPETVEALYGKPLSLSASQLESYNGCAFRYFLTYGLLARERDCAGLEPRSKGTIQHGALYAYFNELKETQADFAAIDKEDCFRKVGQAVEAEARKNSELLYESSAYYQYIVMQMKGIAARTAWEVVKFYRSSRFRPYGFEITIGTKGDIPALSIRTPEGEEIAQIRGLIDRADTAKLGDETLVSITDYKSSAKGLDVQLAEDGITLQPLLYAHALCQSMENAVPAGMMYQQMTDPLLPEEKASNPELAVNQQMRPQGWLAQEEEIANAYGSAGGRGKESFRPSGTEALVSREELAQRIANANEKILQSAQAIAGGEIGANPYRTGKHDACAYCLYGGICKNEINTSTEREENTTA